MKDWRTNFDSILVDGKSLGLNGNVHSGFRGRFEAVLPSLKDTLMKAYEISANKDDVKVFVTGHSQGGAFATLGSVGILDTLEGMGLKKK